MTTLPLSTLDKGLHDFLISQEIITAIVGARIYPDQVPQGQPRPAITYRVPTTDADYHADGPSGLVEATVTVSCQARSHGAAKDLADIVEPLLSGYRGLLTDAPVRAMLLDDVRKEMVPDAAGSDVHFHAVVLDYRAFWQR